MKYVRVRLGKGMVTMSHVIVMTMEVGWDGKSEWNVQYLLYMYNTAAT